MAVGQTQLPVLDGAGASRSLQVLSSSGAVGGNLSSTTALVDSTQTIVDPVTAAMAGGVTETAPASDTASSGHNGRLQRIAQRLTSLIALFPATIGQKAKAAALAVTLASDEDLLANLGGLTETAPASDTASSGLNGRLQRVAQRLTSLIALLPASLGIKTAAASLSIAPASDAVFALASGGHTTAVSFTRPANTTAYAANDAVGATAAALTFANMAGASAGNVMITGASLEVDLAAVPSGMTNFTLYLYSVTPPSAPADNAAWDLPSGDRASFLGAVNIGTPIDLGSTLYVEANNINKHVKLGASTSLFGLLVTAGAYTPTSGEVYVVTLHTTDL